MRPENVNIATLNPNGRHLDLLGVSHLQITSRRVTSFRVQPTMREGIYINCGTGIVRLKTVTSLQLN